MEAPVNGFLQIFDGDQSGMPLLLQQVSITGDKFVGT